jgi:hypothetical protein
VATDLVQGLTINTGLVVIKFAKSLRVDSISSANFEVNDVTSATVAVSSPFRAIDITEDYNSIARELTLYWNEDKLEANKDYELVLTGLIDVADNTLDDETFTFSTGDSVVPEDDELPPEPIVVTIEDHSIRSDAFISTDSIIESNPEFYIIGTDPLNGDFNIGEDYADGRITIKFSSAPSDDFLSSTYFKAQRKKLQRAPSRWETVSTQITKDVTKPWIYIDFPSTDATPVYYTDGKEYFEENYKYRIIISKDIGPE